MRALLLLCLLYPAVGHSEETEPSEPQEEEVRFHDHFLSLQRMQQSLAGRSLEEQTRLQPQIDRAERRACEQLRRERGERVTLEEYRRQGGAPFVAFVLQFERYCQTMR